MKLQLRRIAKRDTYTIGKLYINGEYFCDSLEDRDRGLTSDMSAEEIAKIKVKGETAIPTGKYVVTLKEYSNRFGKQDFYVKNANGGKLPRLKDVPGYEGVLIHVGNYPKDTEGCILVGKNTLKGAVMESRDTFKDLYKRLQEDADNITITIE